MTQFFDRLDHELLTAGRRRNTKRVPRGTRLSGMRIALCASALVAIAAVLYLVVGTGAGPSSAVPVINFSTTAQNTSFAYDRSGAKNRFVGSATCIKLMHDKRLPALADSTAAPNPALVSELSVLRAPSTPIDTTPLGKWDRYPYMISTIFTRYERVYDAPRGVKVAFVPVTYCNQTEISARFTATSHGAATAMRRDGVSVIRETLEQGVVMLLLSNPGEHPPVLVGNAQQIKHGPGLAGLDASNRSGHERGWLETTIVPDGVTHVVMKFTPPFLHHYTVSIATGSNVGVMVRNPPYSPTIVLWYDANGKLVKEFIDRQELAYDTCLHDHDCPR